MRVIPPSRSRRLADGARSAGLGWAMDPGGPRQTFPGDTGDVADLSRNNPSGIRNGTMTWAPGPRGMKLVTGGGTGNLDLGTSPIFNITTEPFALMFWFNAPATSNWLPMARGQNNISGWYLYFQGNGSVQFNACGVGSITSATGIWNAGVDQHFAAVRTGTSSIQLFFNGKAVASGSIGGLIGFAGHMWINNYDYSSGFSIAASYWDARIYKRPVSAGEVAAIYADPTGLSRDRSRY